MLAILKNVGAETLGLPPKLQVDIIVQINATRVSTLMLLRLFVQLPISFSVILCYSLVDMRVNLGAPFVLILNCLVSDRRELSLSDYKLENLFFFNCLI